jgi:hypothetical protein
MARVARRATRSSGGPSPAHAESYYAGLAPVRAVTAGPPGGLAGQGHGTPGSAIMFGLTLTIRETASGPVGAWPDLRWPL